MKIEKFKILEKNSEISKYIKTMIIEHEKCKDFIALFSDIVIDKYIKLSKDPYYQPEIGEKPYAVKKGKLLVTDASIWKNGINFKVEAYGYIYYIFMAPEEIESHIKYKKDQEIINTSKKYNL